MTEAPKITDLPEFWQGYIEEANAENKQLSDLYEAVKAERDALRQRWQWESARSLIEGIKGKEGV